MKDDQPFGMLAAVESSNRMRVNGRMQGAKITETHNYSKHHKC